MKGFCKVLILAAGVIMCSAVSCSRQGDQGAAVRLAYLQNDLHHLPAFVALEKGYFRQEGIDVKIAGVFKAGPEEMSAFIAKELDIGYVGQAPATAAFLNGGADIKFISQVNLEGSSIVVGKESGYKSITGLSGKMVAIPGHATMQDYLLQKAVKKNEMPFEAVRTMVLKPPEMIQALSQKQIDAFIAWEPYPAQAVRAGYGSLLISSGEIAENHPCCVLIADAGFCRKYPDIIKKVQAAHRRSCEFIAEQQEEAIEIGAKYTGVDRDTVAAAISRIKYVPEIDRSKGREFVDFLKGLGYIKPQNADKQLSDIYYE